MSVFKYEVVGVSSDTSEGSDPLRICEFCGFRITEDRQQCPALDDGRCHL